MYLKQLEWTKWAAVDELQRVQAASTAAVCAVVAPVTPPRESTVLPTDIPPVTPHRHVAKSVAAAKAIATPVQPRKTPSAKRDRLTRDAEENDEDELDCLDALGAIPPVRKSPRTATAITRIGAIAERTLRATRSTTNTRKPLTNGTSTTGTKAAVPVPRIPRPVAQAAKSGPPLTRRRLPGSPTAAPSRLPTLARRALAPTSTIPNLRSQGPPAPDAWINKDPSAVVVPRSKSERPLLRSVRRRRSSFSAADVVA